MAAKHRLLALDLTTERLGAFFSDAQHLSDYAEELFNDHARGRTAKAQVVSWHAKHKVIKQFLLGAIEKTQRLPSRAKAIVMTTAPTLEATIGQRPSPMITALWTSSSHEVRILLNLV
jgi:hypothetical protein